MTPAHTPGPWVANPPTGSLLTDPDGKLILGIFVGHTHEARPAAENEANARLVASAPDMYDALNEARREIASFAPIAADWADRVLTKIDRALAKAGGRP